MLSLHGVRAGYGGGTVLNGVNLDVPDGTIVALIGSNGAGKTTTLRVASGLLRPQYGQVVIDGKDLTKGNPTTFARAGVCHIPEGRGIFPRLTVRENLLEFSPDHTARVAISRAIEAFPALDSLMDRIASTLSGGQQQMLSLARAYMGNARFALLDEVSMGLAPAIVEQIFDFIPRLREQGMSLLIVEQYVTKVLAIAEHAYLLRKGEVVYSGSPAELRDSNRLQEEYFG